MTYSEWQKYAERIHGRADMLSRSIVDRARMEATAGGLDGSIPFLTASNCLASAPGTGWAAQSTHKVARRVLFLEEQSFLPGRLASRILDRAWHKVAR